MSEVRGPFVVVWITKGVLSKGIRQVSAELADNGDAWIRAPGSSYTRIMVRAVDVHASPALALKRAMKMRDAKITSLQRQIAKLEKMTTFEVKP